MEYLEGIFIGYRHFERERIPPLFPFGFGMSYTDFSLSTLKVNIETKGRFSCKVSLKVKNTGTREGAEVVQIYIRDPESDLIRPPKELKAFRKIYSPPREISPCNIFSGEKGLSILRPPIGETGAWNRESS